MEFIRENFLIIFALLLLGSGGALLSYNFFWGPNGYKSSDQDSEKIAILKSESSTDKEKYQALLTLGKKQNPECLQIASDLLKNSDSSILRQGAALAMGFYPDESVLEVLSHYLSDNDERVRSHTLQALTKRPSEERFELLKSFLKRKNLSTNEKIEGYMALAQLTPSKEDKEFALQKLMGLLETTAPNDRRRIFMTLLNMFSENKDVVKLAQKVIKESKNPELVAAGIRHLSALGDPWMKSQISEHLQSSSKIVRRATVESIAYACPSNRWELLLDLLENEENSSVITSALTLPLNLKGPRAVKYLDYVIQELSLKEELKATAQETLEKVQEPPQTNLCRQ